MCLKLHSDITLPLIAKEDITVYKHLESFIEKVLNIDDLSSLHGKEFKGIIYNNDCGGIISVANKNLYLCTNDSMLDGNYCGEKFGYSFSWQLDCEVSSVTVNNVELMTSKKVLRTPFREFEVEIGESYTSEIQRCENTIEKGLHSFKDLSDTINFSEGFRTSGIPVIVKCVIPKGSLYYEGTFKNCVSYASDYLKYVEIIH